jgi:hypothetical protein
MCRGGNRPIKDELDVGLFSGSDRPVVKKDDARARFRRGMMKPDREPLPTGFFSVGQDADAGVDRSVARAVRDRAPRRRAPDRVFVMPGPVRLSAQRSPACAASAERFCA